MKNGIYYDTSTASAIAASCFSLHGMTVEETAYCMPEGQLFLVRRINGQETALFPASEEDLLRWKKYRGSHPTQLWMG